VSFTTTDAMAYGALVSPASLDVLHYLCLHRNQAVRALELADRVHRDRDEVVSALGAFVNAGLAQVEDLGDGSGLYGIAKSNPVWGFATTFADRFGRDAEYSANFVAALASNMSRRPAA